MDILESIFALIQKNFLDIITILWIIWFAGVALGIVVSTVSSRIETGGPWPGSARDMRPTGGGGTKTGCAL